MRCQISFLRTRAKLLIFFFGLLLSLNYFAVAGEPLEEKKSLSLIKEAYLKMDKFYFKEIPARNIGNLFYRSQFIMMSLLRKPEKDFSAALNQLTYSTINMIVEALKDPTDRYSKFIYKDYLKRVVREQLKSKFSGIGIEIEQKVNLFFIARVYKDSSASKNGVLDGDQLIAINGKSVVNLKLNDINKALKLKSGQHVLLTLKHFNMKENYEVLLECKLITVPSVSSKFYDDNKIGYIKISSFRDATTAEVKAKINEFERGFIKGLILDLRGNSGGDENQAIALSSLFVKEKSLIAYFLKRDVGRVEDRTTGEPLVFDYPVVILVDKKTGSASEIFVGAIKYYKKAFIVGEKTAGYGSLKNTVSLRDGSALFLITSRTYLPDGSTFDEVGIQPNFEVEGQEFQLQKAFDIIEGRIGI